MLFRNDSTSWLCGIWNEKCTRKRWRRSEWGVYIMFAEERRTNLWCGYMRDQEHSSQIFRVWCVCDKLVGWTIQVRRENVLSYLALHESSGDCINSWHIMIYRESNLYFPHYSCSYNKKCCDYTGVRSVTSRAVDPHAQSQWCINYTQGT